MAEPFIGEIRAFSWGFTPRGWIPCDGRILPINIYQVLYSVVGNEFGGNAVNTFALPDLRGRAAMHPGNGIEFGKYGGEESHQLSIDEIPNHTHMVKGYYNSNTGPSSNKPTGNVWGQTPTNGYADTSNTSMNAMAMTSTGSSQPHSNMQPYLALNYCIAANGIYPSRN
ncbi:phage tail protein [Cohnella boryungensis]|uniref:Phage tail protein n=1 Tax=Cohnella boryungensis TaxID=768479 RepID=A0ABV8SFD0_9BACL